MKTLLCDVGILLEKNDPEFKAYANVYDRKHGYYDENQYYALDFEFNKELVDQYVREGVEGSYGIISETHMPDGYTDDALAEIPVEGETYETENVLYSVMKKDGSLIRDFVDMTSYQPLQAVEAKRMKLILISGKAQHGKDTTAGFMKEYFEEQGKKVLIVHYGDLLKWECSKFFGWNGEKDEYGRSLLQKVGTNLVRERDPDYWVDFLIRTLKAFEGEWDYVLIPDCRFPNEVDKPADVFDAIHIRVFRENFESPLTKEQQRHPSETALDGHSYDVGLINDRGLEEFCEEVRLCAKAILNSEVE